MALKEIAKKEDVLLREAGDFATFTEKGAPVSADLILIEDSAASNAKKKVQVGNLPGGGGGEANTASSQGSGQSLYYQKAGVDLQFYSIKSENNRLGIALDGTSKDIELTVNEGNIDHDALANFVAQEHIRWDLTGGEDIHADRIASGAVTQHEGDIDHDALTNFVAEEHIRWDLTGAEDVHADRIAEAVVTQHEAALTITESQISDLDHDDPDAIHDNVAGEIAALTEKSTPIAADLFLIEDSEASNAKKKVQFGSLIDGAIEIIIGNGSDVITTGQKGHLEVPFDCTIVANTLLADQSGSIVIDIWKDTYANFPPTDADSITASAPPTLSSAQKSQDTTLTGWTKTLTKGDILAYNVDSASTVTRVLLSLKVTKT